MTYCDRSTAVEISALGGTSTRVLSMNVILPAAAPHDEQFMQQGDLRYLSDSTRSPRPDRAAAGYRREPSPPASFPGSPPAAARTRATSHACSRGALRQFRPPGLDRRMLERAPAAARRICRAAHCSAWADRARLPQAWSGGDDKDLERR